MTLESQILAALDTPLAFPQLEQKIYPNGRPDTWEDFLQLGLTLERMVNKGIVHRRITGAVKKSDSEFATTVATWPLYSAKPIPKNFVAPTRQELRANQ